MSNQYELAIESRQAMGKGPCRRMRRLDNQIPGVIYGAGKESTPIMVNYFTLNNALKNESFYSHILTLKLDGKEEKVVLKDIHRHPYKPMILHIDFQRISATEKLYMTIPLHFIGEDVAPGAKSGEGIISHVMNEVEIRCLPADLPEYIEVDVSNLGMDESIHLSELKVPKGVEIVALLHDKDQQVVNIHKPHIPVEPEEVVAPSPDVPVVGEEGEAAEGAGEENKE